MPTLPDVKQHAAKAIGRAARSSKCHFVHIIFDEFCCFGTTLLDKINMPLRQAQPYAKSSSVDCLESVALFGTAELSILGIF